MSYLPSHCDHSNWVKTQPQRQRFYAQLESFIWLLNLLRAGYCSCGRRRSTLSLVLDPRTTGVDSANSLFQTGHQRKGTLFQRYQQISVVTSIMVSIRAGRVKQQKSKVLALVNASLLEVLAGLLNSCMLLLLQPDSATYWARGTSFHGHHGWRRVKQQKSKVLALENASLLEVLQLSH